MALVAGIANVVISPTAESQTAPAVIPAQWIAKQFTEALGRTPTPAEWNSWTAHFQTAGCSADSLKTKSRELLVGGEFAGLYPEASAKGPRVLALVRTVYNHEPNTSDWTAYTAYANSSKTWAQTVDGMFNYVWGGWVVPGICDANNPSYGFGNSPALDVKNLVGQGASRTAATLQSQLNAATASCGTVSLAPGEVVRVNGQLIQVPACVRLTTTGAPSARAYARQARIVVEGNACVSYLCVDTPAVVLGRGAELRNVWVAARNATDGRKTVGVQLDGSSAADPGVVDNVRVSDPGAGGTGIRVMGFGTSGIACAGARVTNNVVTGYARTHALDRAARAQWADGITTHCEDTLVENNHIVDVGDWGIGLHGVWQRTSPYFPETGLATQTSKVRGNRVLSAGVPGSVAVGIDPNGICSPTEAPALPVACIDRNIERSFAGTVIENNTFWTGARTSFDIGLMVGGKAYWGDHGSYGRGAVVRNNTTGVASARVNVGIAVSGMYDTTLTGNTGSGGTPGSFTLVDSIGDTSGDLAGCPQVAVGDTRPYLASFTAGAQPSTTTGLYGCLLAPFPTGGLERLITSTDGGGTFKGATTGATFAPWGYNYGPEGGLLDDNWNDPATFKAIVNDLREHKQLGANTLRIHPQLNKFMTGPTTVNPAAFAQLNRLAVVAEKLGIYLDVTGLGMWRKSDNNIPDENPAADANDWLSSNDEAQQWRAQEIWWEEAARVLKDRTSIAWFNLMNEMVVINTPNWCDGEYGGLCFVQSITKTVGSRTQASVYLSWIERMRKAIERGEGKLRTVADHRVTASNLLFPDKAVTGTIDDFMIIHAYPGDDPATPNVNEWEQDMQRIKNTKVVGKPLVVEEFFYPLDGKSVCPGTCLEESVNATRPEANGWLGHAGGLTLAQGAPILSAAYMLFVQKNASVIAPCYACQPS